MVTVIIPTYKRADFIERAINSVLIQTYSDLEVIVVDDNNSESEERKVMENVMEKYRNELRVRYVKHLKNMNGAAARNTGIREARGEYITFLDDDDFFLKDRIKELVDNLEVNKSYDAVYTGGFIICKDKIIDAFEAKREGNLQLEILKQIPVLKTGSNMFFRANILKELNGFDTDFLRHQDLEFMVRFFRNHKIKAVNTYTVVKDETSRINIPNIKKALNMKELYLKKFKMDIEKYKNKEEIYIENYKALLFKCKKEDAEYNYIKNKLEMYGYKQSIFLFLKQNIKKTLLKNIYYPLKGKFKSRKINANIVKEVKEIMVNS